MNFYAGLRRLRNQQKSYTIRCRINVYDVIHAQPGKSACSACMMMWMLYGSPTLASESDDADTHR